ncbi:YbgA family protein [Thalassotalea litorea]|uniref:YbgA family protein n=1 Tax=Thalassotalea litorea TaxID=2020715 RepID=UPI003734DB86
MSHQHFDTDINIGISACLIGQKVRFDASHKQSQFCVNEFGEHVKFVPYCPEVAIGLPVPRPTVRQIDVDGVIHVSRPDGTMDVTDKLRDYGQKVAPKLADISGYVFCAKSPSCGMERVKVYSQDGKGSTSDGIGVFAREIMKRYPYLPCEENGRLNDARLRENFVARVFAYKHFQTLEASGLSKHKLMVFHSQYKYLLMSHDILKYREAGRLLAKMQDNVDEIGKQYLAILMTAMKKIASRKGHANTLQHIQGYFSNELNGSEKQELCQHIEDYRAGLVPLMVPLTMIKHYLMEYPKDYLAQQVYLQPHPVSLKLRYSH